MTFKIVHLYRGISYISFLPFIIIFVVLLTCFFKEVLQKNICKQGFIISRFLLNLVWTVIDFI